jgi:hypothetical protein
VIPRRYLFATLFIAAMLLLLAIVQAPKSTREGGVGAPAAVAVMGLDTFETLAELPLVDGWSPRFQGAMDPDQSDPWPFPGGFGTPWEPASPYLMDQGLALNGPGGRSEVALWRSQEWRHYRFDAPLVSARLDPLRGRLLLVTLATGPRRFETRLLEVPEGRPIWSADSGPWSRFSWDGRAVLLGLATEGGQLLSALPVEGEIPGATLAPWDEKDLPRPPRAWPVKESQLWPDAQDIRGARLLVPWGEDARLWFPRGDRLWISQGGQWSLWNLEDGTWRRSAAGSGVLSAQPPRAMGRVSAGPEGTARFRSSLQEANWEPVDAGVEPWPAYDPAWCWGREGALTAWDLRWGGASALSMERQRDSLRRMYRADWKMAAGIRASVAGWLPQGPEVALRETVDVAWVWLGNRILLVRLQPTERARKLKSFLSQK